jgi:putative transposase
MRKSYATDLSDSEWAFLRDLLPELPKRVKPRAHSLRDIFYVLKSGCHWRLLPHDFPPWQTVSYHFRRFRLSGMWHRIFTILRAAERKRTGR